MKSKVLFVFFSAVCFLISCASCVNEDNLKLDLIQVIFRHGARAPSKEEAGLVNITDPSIYKPFGFFQLTNFGKSQAYKLGLVLKDKYKDFLGEYKHEELYGLSSNSSRTKMSLQLLLAGLFPPPAEKQWNPNLKWTPIPFHQVTTKVDVLLAPHQSPKFKKLHLSESGENTQRLIANYTDFLEMLKNKTEKPVELDILYFTGWLYILIKTHKLMDLPLPSWITEEVTAKLKELFMIGLESMSLTTRLKKLNGGTMIRQVIENINKNSDSPRKIYLYSTHDLTVAGFILANGIKLTNPPEFGSAIIVETYKDDQKNTYIRMIWWNGMGENFKPLVMKNCPEYCPFSKYANSVQDVIPSDEDLKYLDDV